MYVLKVGQRVVGFAATDSEANEKISIAAGNGHKVVASKINTDDDYFAVRDYNQEFRDLIGATRANLIALKNFNYDALTMQAGEYNELAEFVVENLEDKLAMVVAKYSKMYLHRGEYGYGRELNWNSSSCYGEEPEWQSSSSTC